MYGTERGHVRVRAGTYTGQSGDMYGTERGHVRDRPGTCTGQSGDMYGTERGHVREEYVWWKVHLGGDDVSPTE